MDPTFLFTAILILFSLCHPPSGQAYDECPWLTFGETEPMRGRSWPSSIHSQGGIHFWVSWLQSQSLSYQLPPASPDALFMAHYLPPADAQMPPARAVTLLHPLERTKGSSFSLILSPSSPLLQPLWVSAVSWGVAQLVPSSHPGEQFPLCPVSQCFHLALGFLNKAAAANTVQAHHPLITAPA